MFNGFSHSVKGASHDKSGLVCQDSSSHKVTDRYAIAVVADGHGSKKHFRSDKGSKFAVEATIEAIDTYFEDYDQFVSNFPSNHKMIIKNIQKQAIFNWNKKVNAHLLDNEAIPPESYYGSTLIAGIAAKDFTFGIQIGDGSLVAIFDDGEAIMPMEYNEAAPANVTASMCNSNAASMFSGFYVENKKLIAMYASTDGLYTSFGSERDFLDYHTIITSQLANIENFKTVIINNLTKRSHFGTEDDISLSCVFDTDIIDTKMDLIVSKVEENKKRAAARKAELLTKKIDNFE